MLQVAREPSAERDSSCPPQVVVQASGDLVPFEVLLRRDGTDEVRRVAGSDRRQVIAGKIDDATQR